VLQLCDELGPPADWVRYASQCVIPHSVLSAKGIIAATSMCCVCRSGCLHSAEQLSAYVSWIDNNQSL
jgi:hypothetical protein